MKKPIMVLAIGLAFAVFWSGSVALAFAGPVYSAVKRVNGFSVNVVSVDYKDPSISVKPVMANQGLARQDNYPSEGFASFINRAKPIAAINGTYHDTITYKPVGTIIVDGKVKNIGCIGTVVAFTYDGDIQFYLSDSLKKYYIPWNSFEQVICTGPTLVYNSKFYLNPRGEGFRDPKVLGYAARSVLGFTNKGRLLFVTIRDSVSLNEAALIMLGLDCKYAVCLDGGSSSGLYCEGKYLTYTARPITNILAVNQNNLRYAGFMQTSAVR